MKPRHAMLLLASLLIIIACQDKKKEDIRSVGVALKIPLPPGRARAFDAAGKQGFVWGW